jgi:hypothetical protein
MPDLAPADPLDFELASRLGQIVVRWASLEYWISLLLRRCSRLTTAACWL